jgi:outer membrane protein assembly factor BamB
MRKHRNLGLIAVVGLLAAGFNLLARTCVAADWPCFRGPDRNGVAREELERIVWPPQYLWTAEVARGYGSAAIVGDRLYVDGWSKDGRNHVWCLDAGSGKAIWEQSFAEKEAAGNGGPRGTPFIDGEHLYTYSQHGRLHCWAVRDGKELWQTAVDVGKPNWSQSGSPVVTGEVVLLHAGDSGFGVNKKTGAVLWKSAGMAGYSTPVVDQRGGIPAMVLKTQGGAVGREADTGKVLWSYGALGSDIECMDAVLYGRRQVLLGGKGGWGLLDISGDKPAEVWKFGPRNHPTHREFNMRFSNSILVAHHFYAWHEYHFLRCVDVRTGAVAWERDDKDFAEGAMIASADGRIIAVSVDGRLAVFRAKPEGFDPQGRTIWKGKLGGNCRAVSLSGGRLYVRNEAGMLSCLRISEGRGGHGAKP